MEKTISQKTIILAILLLAAILSPLDFYIVNLALTPIQKGLNASTSQLQMIISLYTCAYAVFQIGGGRLGDLIGKKRMFLIGLMGFIVSSTICGLATTAPIMIFGRILQGISGAVLAPQILSIIHTTYKENEKPKVLGLYGFTFGIAAVIGQYLSGLLISYNILGLGWRSIFLINIPIGLLAWIGAVFLLPKSEKKKEEYIDFIGMALFSLALALIVYPLTLFEERGADFLTTGLLMCGGFLFLLFVLYEDKLKAKGRTPLIDTTLFRYRNLTIGSIVAFLSYCAGVFYVILSIYLQEGQHWSPLEAGEIFIPYGIAYLIFSLASPFLVKWIGNYVLNTGIFLYALGFSCIIYSISLTNPTSYIFVAGLFIAGSGMGIAMPSLIRISLNNIPFQYAGLASGIINSMLQIGSAVSVAGIGSVFFSLQKTHDSGYAFQVTMSVVVFILLMAFCTSLLITRQKRI